MLRAACFMLLVGVCVAGGYGYYKPKPKPKPKRCYSCEYSPPKMTTRTVYKTEEFETKVPMTKVHCWYSFKVDGKPMDIQSTAQSQCSQHKPSCKTMTTYRVVKNTRKVPMQVTEMSGSGGFEGCKGPINHYNEKKLGVDTWPCYDNCFIRKDQHGRIARGCFSYMDGVDQSQLGCSMQGGEMYCFCEKDRCNGQAMNSGSNSD